MFGDKYFSFIKRCRDLLGKPSTADDADEVIAMCNDISWFGCYDDGMTPEQAVDKYQRKTLN